MTPPTRLWLFGDGALAVSAARGLSALDVAVVRVGALHRPGPWTWMATAPAGHASIEGDAVVLADHPAALETQREAAQRAGLTVRLTVAPATTPTPASGTHLRVGPVWGPDVAWVARLQRAVADRPHRLWLPDVAGLRPTTPHGLAQAILARVRQPSASVWTLTGATHHRLHDLGNLVLRHAGHPSLTAQRAPTWATALRYGLRAATLREWVAASTAPNATEGWLPDEPDTRWDWVAPRTRRTRAPG